MLFNKTNKLDKADLEELREKVKLINQHIAIAQALEVQKTAWLVGLFPKYRMGLEKEYNFSLKTGEITEVKQPTKGGEA